MGGNFGFGRRVKRAREDLGMKRKRLAELSRVEGFRLEMIETEQMDESDLTGEELKQLSQLLRRPLSWLVHGVETSGLTPSATTIAQRSHGGALQQQIDFGLENCPRCYHRLSFSSSRCDNCGLGLD